MAVLETKEPPIPEPLAVVDKPAEALGLTGSGKEPSGTDEPVVESAAETRKRRGRRLLAQTSFGQKPLDPGEILAQARETLTVRRVFGEPIEKEGLTIVPVAQVMGGFGAGGPAEPSPTEGKTAAMAPTESTKPAAPVGIGGGFGVVARPAGVYVIREGRVRWVPSVDVTRLVFRMMLGAAAILWVIRPLLMLRAKAKTETT